MQLALLSTEDGVNASITLLSTENSTVSMQALLCYLLKLFSVDSKVMLVLIQCYRYLQYGAPSRILRPSLNIRQASFSRRVCGTKHTQYLFSSGHLNSMFKVFFLISHSHNRSKRSITFEEPKNQVIGRESLNQKQGKNGINFFTVMFLFFFFCFLFSVFVLFWFFCLRLMHF